MDTALEVSLRLENINKWYPNPKAKGAVHALSDIYLVLSQGIYGLTGKNGAGKTTLMQILTGFLQPDSGEIYFNEQKVLTRSRSYKSLLGYMPQQQTVYDTMTCIQFMNYMSAMKGLKNQEKKEQVPELLQRVHLWEKRFCKINTLSGGMKQRLLFAQACIGTPRLLLLDEPTAGVDPEERENLQQLILDNSGGRVVLLSTHILSDIESIAKEEIKLITGKIEKK